MGVIKKNDRRLLTNQIQEFLQSDEITNKIKLPHKRKAKASTQTVTFRLHLVNNSWRFRCEKKKLCHIIIMNYGTQEHNWM